MAKVLVVGDGGREHAIVRALSDDADVEHIYCAPGNGGTAAMEGVNNISQKSKNDLTYFAKENEIDLVVIGPEQPLCDGLANVMRSNGLRVFGFKASAAKLEGSKVFAKEFMQRYSIPTAGFEVFGNFKRAVEYLEAQFEENPDARFFIKADELCGGKGAIPAFDLTAGKQALRSLLLDNACGVGAKVVIEESIRGQEASIFALTDGETVITLPPAQDHKRINDNDEGPNTGGMGAYAPAHIVDEKVYERIEQEILLPTIMGMEEERISDCGVLFIGVMIDPKGKPYVLEYNVRFGDPEAQPLLTLLKSDLYPILVACTEGKLAECDVKWHYGSALSVVISVKGYPAQYDHQDEVIRGIEDAEALEDVVVYHAGTTHKQGKFFTKGGRILGVTALGSDTKAAQKRAYEAVAKIKFSGMHFRTDIGHRAL